MTTQGRASVPPRAIGSDGRLDLALRVNGVEHRMRVRPTQTLLEVLRGPLGLTGPRGACGIGMCGACTVLMDGRTISACLVLAPLAEGHEIETIEGLETPGGELHPIHQAYLDHTGFQCSYCTPGFILATKALLAENPDPTPEEAKAYLAGNLCRCGSYVKILDSVLDAAQRLREPEAAQPEA